MEKRESEPERYVAYEDGDLTVVCDSQNVQAWIESERTVPIRR